MTGGKDETIYYLFFFLTLADLLSGRSSAVSGHPEVQSQFGKYITTVVAMASSASTHSLLLWEPLEILK